MDYHRHHCGYLVGIGFPPSRTGGSMVTSLQPGSERVLGAGMVFHAHCWFTNTILLTESGAGNLISRSPQGLILG